MRLDPWRVLGIAPGATAKLVHDAWRRQVSRWHPDRNRSAEATRRLQEINDAYTSIRHHTAMPESAPAPEPILAGVSGTVFGEHWSVNEVPPARATWCTLEIPAVNWLDDSAVTLDVAVSPRFATIVTLPCPGELHDGDLLRFRRSSIGADGTVTDLFVTIRLARLELPRLATDSSALVQGDAG